MRFNALGIALLGFLITPSLHAQDLTGDWQGVLQAPAQQPRMIVRLRKGDDGGWTGALSAVDSSDWGSRSTVSQVVLQGKNVTFVVDALGGSYQGRLSTDGTSIHYVFQSNEADILREMNAFLATLK